MTRSHRDQAPSIVDLAVAFDKVAEAARDRQPVAGWTHNFYRYPARFSPRFAAAAIANFSQPGDIVADPYMGGGTAVVEGVVAGREVIGNDLNSLAAFIAKVKTTPLTEVDVAQLREWVREAVPKLSYRAPATELAAFVDTAKTKNLSLVRARFIKKIVAGAIASIGALESECARNFARCAVLRVSQWALDGREKHTPLESFRTKLALTTQEMLIAIDQLSKRVRASGGITSLFNLDAADLHNAKPFRDDGKRVSLVVTSPPYPGVHVLYHRWQVDGRRETPAPYWITGCNDGKGASFYNFGDRRDAATERYFSNSLTTLCGIRKIMRDGAVIVQMVAFNRPDEQLPRYLGNMREAGFDELPVGAERIWRQVPNRKWHARIRGMTASANEVVLVHRAI